MAVVFPRGLVGVIDRVGPAGAQVQLITDRSFRATAQFFRFVNEPKPAYLPVGAHLETPGTLIGALVIAVIQNGMNLTGVESYTQKVVLGLVILGAVLLDRLKQRRSAD